MLHAVLAYRLDVVAFALLALGLLCGTHAWLRRTGRAPGAPRVAWLALAMVIVGGAWLAEFSGNRERDTLRSGMESFARTYAAELEHMGHARLTWDTPPDDPAYLAMIAAEVRWLRANPAVNDIYTFRARPDGTIAFVVDSETDYDHNGRYEGEREGRTAIGENFPQADENMARALRGVPAFNEKPVTDRWGTWVNAYVPLRDPADPFGRVNAGLGVDYDAAGWTATILVPRAARLAGCTLLASIVAASTASLTALRAEVARRASAEDALRREEERFRLAAHCASDVIFEWDVAGGGLRWFGGSGGQLGFAEGQFPPTIDAWERAIHPEDRERVVAALKRHIADGTPYCEEYRITAADGTTHDWVDRGVVVRPEAGGTCLMIGAVSDVTSRNRARALESERESLRKAVQSMEQVLGVVGHELRTPLAGVRAMSEFLMSEGAAEVEGARNFLASIHGEVVRMSGTVNDLLEAARINSGLSLWNWGPFRPADACGEAIETVRSVMSGSEVELTFVEEPEAAGAGAGADTSLMLGDAGAVRRLALNLLDNARKHTAAGSIRLTVRRRRDEQGRAWADIEVADTGAGIPPEIVARLGQAFLLNAGLVGDRHITGAGLGLAICKGIVHAHGGRLHVRSVVGTGTVVTATLRADLPAPAPGSGTVAPALQELPAELPAT